jgi:hypothetical protein
MKNTSPEPSFHLGGQALIEGVLMRSPHYVAAAVRRADGTIETRVEPFQSVLTRYKWLQIPLLRGTIALFEMMLLGMRFLHWSSHLALEDSAALTTAHDGTARTPAADEPALKMNSPATGPTAQGEMEASTVDLTGVVGAVLPTPVATTRHGDTRARSVASGHETEAVHGTAHPNGTSHPMGGVSRRAVAEPGIMKPLNEDEASGARQESSNGDIIV